MDTTRSFPSGTVTFLFTDIEGSTRLWEQHPEAMRHALARHDALAATILPQHGGLLVKSRGEGDSLFAVFSASAHALSAAAALQRAFLSEPWLPEAPLRVRMALHTGEADLRADDYYGPAVNRCARLRAAGHGGQVLVSSATRQVVGDLLPPGIELRDLGERRLKDLIQSERIFQLVHPELPQEFPPLATLDLRPHNLPAQPTPLIGRQQEMSTVRDLLRHPATRLVTLTGPGGTGKTRLGLQVAADVIDAFDHGVFFVSLAPISDPDLLVSTVAQVLGVREQGGQALLESLQEYLQERQMLLVLDNFEQILEAAPVVAELLAAAPRLKVLVTSRAVLRLRGEQEFPVPPLPVPDPKRRTSLETLSQYAAVELFIQRARNVKPELALTVENAPAVAEICHQLDGLPLAIELAAARTRIFALEALSARLENRLKLLTGGARDLPERQQTLRNAIAWSYDLLAAGEQRLFRRLSVFVGGFALEAAEAVCNAEGDLGIELLDGVASLVDKSLLQQEDAEGEPRFRKLETIRQYAQECLAQSDETEVLRRQHASYYMALASEVEKKLEGPAEAWRPHTEWERDNLRATLGWCLETGAQSSDRQVAQDGLSVGVVLGWLVPWSEGREWLAKLLVLPGAIERNARRASALYTAGVLAWLQADYEVMRPLLEESLAIERELGNRDRVALVVRHLGFLFSEQLCDWEAADAHYREALTIRREMGDMRGVAACNASLAFNAHAVGDYPTAVAHWEESLAITRELGDPGLAPLSRLQELAYDQGDYQTARVRFEEQLAIIREQCRGRGVSVPARSVDELFAERGDLSAIRVLAEERVQLERALRNPDSSALVELAMVAHDQADYPAARGFLEKALAVVRAEGAPRAVATSLTQLARTARRQGDYALARACCEESLALRRKSGAKRRIATSLNQLGSIASDEGEYQRAEELLQQSLAIQRAIGDRRGIAISLCDLGNLARRRADYETASAFLQESLGIKRALGLRPHVASALRALGSVALGQRNTATARAHFAASVAMSRELEDPLGTTECLEGWAAAEAAERPERAPRLMGAAEALREAIGAPVPPADRVASTAAVGIIRAALGEEAFAASWAEGRAMTVEQGVAYALEEPDAGTPSH